MHTYGAHGATDVTGFGIVGHAANLVQHMKAAVDFELTRLPVLAGMLAVNDIVDFQLRQGYSAETSGGLLVAVPGDKAAAFCKDIEALDGVPAWVVGQVVAGSRTARLSPTCEFFDVSTPQLPSL